MKLLNKITLRLSIFLFIVVTIWALLFYFAIMREIIDEVEDAFEDYSEIKNDKKEKNQNFEFDLAMSNFEKEDIRVSIIQWTIILYIALIVVLIVVNIWIYYHSMKPLYVLLKWLDDYVIGKVKPLDNKTNITEFQKLNEVVIRNANRNEIIFKQQKQFIENASHEMQTPLAICYNRLEMLIDNSNLNEEQLGEIIKTQKTLSYIIKLNKSLLFLSKIENKQFEEISIINFNSLIKQHSIDYEEAYSYRNISLKIEEHGQLSVPMNESLAVAMITNLLKNTYTHNIDNGNIIIEIFYNNIVFKNTGENKALNTNLIFNRFYQEKKKEGSTGLGLAIVDTICKLYKFRIKYDYKNNMHQFSVFFQI